MLMHKAASSLLHIRSVANVIPQSVKAAFQGGSQAASGGIINVQSVGAGSSNGSAGGAWNAGRNFSGYQGSGRAFSQTVPGTNSTGTANTANDDDEDCTLKLNVAGRSRSNSFSSAGAGRSARGKKMGTLQLVQMQGRFRNLTNVASMANKAVVISTVSEAPSSPRPNVLLVRRNSTSAVQDEVEAQAQGHWTPTTLDVKPSSTDTNPKTISNSNEPQFLFEDSLRSNLDNLDAFKPLNTENSRALEITRQEEHASKLSVAAQKGSVKLFECVAELEATGLTPKLAAYSSAICKMLECREAGTSIHPIRYIWNALCLSGNRPDQQSFEAIIMALCVRESEIVQRLNAPNVTKKEIKQLKEEENLTAAISLIKEADRSGVDLSLDIYEYLMLLCGDSEHYEYFQQIFEIVEKASTLEPTPLMVQMLMDSAGKASQSSEIILKHLEKSKTYTQKSWSSSAREDIWLTCIKNLQIIGATSKARFLVDEIKAGHSYCPRHTNRLDVVEIELGLDSSISEAIQIFNQVRSRNLASGTNPESYTLLLDEALRVDDILNINLVWQAMLDDSKQLPEQLFSESLFLAVLTRNIDHMVRVKENSESHQNLSNLISRSIMSIGNSISNRACTSFIKQLLRVQDYSAILAVLHHQQVPNGMSAESSILQQAGLLNQYAHDNLLDISSHSCSTLLQWFQSLYEKAPIVMETVAPEFSRNVKDQREQALKTASKFLTEVSPIKELCTLILSNDVFLDANRTEFYTCQDFIQDLENSTIDSVVLKANLPTLERHIRSKSRPADAVLLISRLRQINESSKTRPASQGHIGMAVSEQSQISQALIQNLPPALSNMQMPQIRYPVVRKICPELSSQISKHSDWRLEQTACKSFQILNGRIGDGIFPDALTLANLISGLGRESMSIEMHHTYNLAQEVLRFEQSSHENHLAEWIAVEDSMIKGCSALSLNGQAMIHRQRIIDIGAVPTADAYASLIVHSTDSADDASLALGLWQEARSLGCQLNTYSYNTIISRLAKARKLAMCLNLLQEMKASKDCQPTVVTYGAILNACCRIGDESSAELYFKEMLKIDNYRPKLAPFNTMMQFYVSTKPDRLKFYKYFDQLKSSGIAFSEHTYKLLLQAAGQLHPVDTRKMMDVFRKIATSNRIKVTGNHWASIITSCGDHQNDIPGMQLLFEQISDHPASAKSGTKLPDTICYEALFACLLKAKMISALPSYLERMEREGIKSSTYIENIRISAAVSQGDIAAARSIFEAMDDPPMGVSASETVSIGRKPRILLRQPSTWQTMIQAELDAGIFQNAEQLTRRMEARQYPQSIMNKIYDILHTHKKSIE